MNRLSNEKSEYLKQHSTNPVDWYPWGEEAFAKARAENKPIFLSSGYSSCHWCHVMEKESFSHPKIAEILNQFYVPIKLDREERPDIDAIYMKAVQAMTGQGGWPLNVWLSPDLRPFFGGTYFPPEPRYGQPAFQDVLTQVHQAFHEQPEAVKKNSDSLMNILVQSGQYFEPKEDVHSSELVQISVKNLKQLADKENGGFGKAPKFFYSDGLRILLKASVVFQDREALAIAEKSLIKMACGGVYDQVGGGFHRYSTDEEWTIPHFEKMLYDNALMARVYLEAYQRTQNQFYSEMAVEILNFCLRDFKNPKAGFASTIDADSADGEGYFYSWSVEELRSLFNEEDFQFIYSHFGFEKRGDFNGRQVLCLESPLSTSGKLRFSKIRDILLKTRNLRKHPLVDTKLQTGWNSLLITSLAQCGFHLGRPDLLAEAENCLEFIWENAWSEKGLAHFLYGEEPSEVCLFEDSAYLAEALSALISCTGKSIYSDRLFELLNKISEDFYDSESGGFWSTSDRQVDVPVRSKEILDSALPSPYSVALQAFSFASDLTGDRQYSEVFNRSLQLVLGTAEKQVGGFSRLAVCLLEREGQKTNSFCTPETCGT